jgi:hypothetical protein
MKVGTVKASNIGPHGNFGVFSEKLAIIKKRPTEKRMEQKL